MSLSRKTKVFFTLAFTIAAIILAIMAVNWVLSHALILVVLASLGGVGYYMYRRSALIGGRRTLL